MHSIKVQIGEFQCNLLVNFNTITATRWDVLRHCNAQHELHIPLCGKGILDVEKETFILDKGSCLLIPPGKYHSHKKISEDYSHFVISFFVNDKKLFNDCVRVQLSDFEVDLCHSIIDEISNKGLFWQDNICAMYTLVLSKVFSKLPNMTKNTENKIMSNVDKRIEIIDNFFEQNLTENSTQEELSAELNLSLRQLNRVLKTQYGMTFREKLRQARMDRAVWLLRTTDKTTSKICEEIGYNSETSFFKAFKNQYGMSPKEYKREFNKNGDNQKII